MTKLIEAIHSTYGLIKLSVEKSDYNTLLFKRQDGSQVGEMDEDSGGMVFKHPNITVANFLEQVLDKDLIEVDEHGYIQYEDLMYEAANEAFPGFFKEESEEEISFGAKTRMLEAHARKLGLQIEKITAVGISLEDVTGIPRKD